MYYDEIYEKIAILELEIKVLETEEQTERVSELLKNKRERLENLVILTQISA